MANVRTVMAALLGLSAMPYIVLARAARPPIDSATKAMVLLARILVVGESLLGVLLLAAALGTRQYERAPLVGLLASLVAAVILLRYWVKRAGGIDGALVVFDVARLVLALALIFVSFS